MDLDLIKDALKLHVYHIPSDKNVPLHKHDDLDEIFYCIKGSGFGVLEDSEVIMHSLRSDDELYVTALLVPVVDGKE